MLLAEYSVPQGDVCVEYSGKICADTYIHEACFIVGGNDEHFLDFEAFQRALNLVNAVIG